MNKVKIAVIPAAGHGTRFLPATKSVPKEMMPIYDAPSILYVVEEAVAAGAEQIILITGRGKQAIEDFFDISFELEHLLSKQSKEVLLERVFRVREKCQFISIRQGQALGLGHAIGMASSVVGDQPFAVLLPDELDFGNSLKRLVTAFNESGISQVAVMQVAPEEVKKYGIVAFQKNSRDQMELTEVIEKPSLELAPSRFALPGRYVFASSLFAEIANTRPGKNGEIQLTDGMTALAKKHGMHAIDCSDSVRFDAGDRLGFVKATLHVAMQDPNIQLNLRSFLKSWRIDQ